MTLILKQMFSLLKLLNSETGTNQIAAGVALGFIMGMAPAFSTNNPGFTLGADFSCNLERQDSRHFSLNLLLGHLIPCSTVSTSHLRDG